LRRPGNERPVLKNSVLKDKLLFAIWLLSLKVNIGRVDKLIIKLDKCYSILYYIWENKISGDIR
jgi:hypothetical protein